MQAATAQLPDFAESDDKVFTTPNAVIVLDGASAFRTVPVPASVYAAHLGFAIRDQLLGEPARDLREALGAAIRTVTSDLELTPGDSPSSTVAIARAVGDYIDALALGDSPLVFPSGVLSDDRIDDLELPERARYRARLAEGGGYTEEHRELLQQLQERQAKLRNRQGGYWIAEADPRAASQAIVNRYPTTTNPWTILATDGAFNPITHLGSTTWHAVADSTGDELHNLLRVVQRWEAENDPHGQDLPRAKRHDDKALAVARWTP